MVRSSASAANDFSRNEALEASHPYLAEIRRYEPLTREEEAVCARLAREGDQAAFNRLAEANLRFVVKIALQYKGRGMTLPELISEGNMGLIKAIARFDETLGYKFISYAVWWIRQAIHQGLARTKGGTTITSNRLEDSKAIKKETDAVSQNLMRETSFDEIGELLGFDRDRTDRAIAATTHDLSLDVNLFDDNNSESWASRVVDDVDIEEEFEKQDLAELARHCVEILDEREQYIVSRYFGLDGTAPMVLEQIGETLGITRERTRQLRNRALKKIREQYGDLLIEFSRN